MAFQQEFTVHETLPSADATAALQIHRTLNRGVPPDVVASRMAAKQTRVQLERQLLEQRVAQHSAPTSPRNTAASSLRTGPPRKMGRAHGLSVESWLQKQQARARRVELERGAIESSITRHTAPKVSRYQQPPPTSPNAPVYRYGRAERLAQERAMMQGKSPAPLAVGAEGEQWPGAAAEEHWEPDETVHKCPITLDYFYGNPTCSPPASATHQPL